MLTEVSAVEEISGEEGNIRLAFSSIALCSVVRLCVSCFSYQDGFFDAFEVDVAC